MTIHIYDGQPRLSPQEKIVMKHRHEQGLTQAETARKMGVSESTVRGHERNALEKTEIAKSMKGEPTLFSTGEVAKILGISWNRVNKFIQRNEAFQGDGAHQTYNRGHRWYTADQIEQLRQIAKGES